jgi:hypothetical protein
MPRNGDDYEVGYKKPPAHTRFHRGQSGNPQGRPRGSKNLATLLDEELKETIDIRDNNGHARISKARAIARQMVNSALKGDPRMIKLCLDTASKQAALKEHPNEDTGAADAAEDAAILERFKQRLGTNTNDTVH